MQNINEMNNVLSGINMNAREFGNRLERIYQHIFGAVPPFVTAASPPEKKAECLLDRWEEYTQSIHNSSIYIQNMLDALETRIADNPVPSTLGAGPQVAVRGYDAFPR